MAKKTGASRRSNIKTREKEMEVVRLRRVGLSFAEIAKQLDYSNESGPYKALMRHMERNVTELQPSTEAVRQEELGRLDWWLQNISAQIIAGDVPAVNTALRISERKAALLGLDAPKQFEARLRVDVVSWNQAIRDFLDIYREYHGDSPDAPALMDRVDKLAEERFAGVIQ
jgi:hypothetical protein